MNTRLYKPRKRIDYIRDGEYVQDGNYVKQECMIHFLMGCMPYAESWFRSLPNRNIIAIFSEKVASMKKYDILFKKPKEEYSYDRCSEFAQLDDFVGREYRIYFLLGATKNSNDYLRDLSDSRIYRMYKKYMEIRKEENIIWELEKMIKNENLMEQYYEIMNNGEKLPLRKYEYGEMFILNDSGEYSQIYN